MSHPRPRAAFTVVELMVVVGLMVSLFGFLMVMGRPSQKTGVRQAAQQFASLLLAAQSRALGTPEGAGLIIVPIASGTVAANTVHEAAMLPHLRASVANLTTTGTMGTVDFTPGDAPSAADLATGYKLRFESSAGGAPPSPWFGFTFTPPTTANVRFRDSAGQTTGNTIWPLVGGPTPVEAVIARCPQQSNASTTFGKQPAIDLRYSGVGEWQVPPSHVYQQFAGSSSIAVVYDRVGRVAEVMRLPADQPITPVQPIYVFFVPAEMIAAGMNTLSSDAAVWVAINPQSGRVTVAANVPQQGTTAADVNAARENARRGVALK